MALVKRVLIVGAGIGGMSAAIQLSKQGVEVDVVELNPNGAPEGAGITISSPTLRALREVGVVEEVLARGGNWAHIDFCRPDGTVMNTVAMKPSVGAEDLPPGAGIMRPILAEILGRAMRESGATVRLGVGFDRIEQDADGVDVAFTDGSRGRYDLVVGADGVNSNVRKLVVPDFAGSKFTGQGSWRAVVPRSRRNSVMFMGETTKAGFNPVSEDHCYLFVLDRREGMEFLEPGDWPRMLADLLVGFGAETAEVAARLRSGDIDGMRLLYRPLMGHLVDAPWHRGRIVLLGDAVHATTPHLASGAGIAVEGALILAEELGRRHSLEGALVAYCGRHYDRARLVVGASGRLGQIEQGHGTKEEHQQVMVHAMDALRASI